jgi:hypothetical protein
LERVRLAVVWALLACGGEKTDSGPEAADPPLRIILMADTHLIDDFYTCCESTDLDTSSLQLSEARLRQALDDIATLDPAPQGLFVAGDVIHDYPSADLAFYEREETAFDLAQSLRALAPAPVHFALGNHDYDLPEVPREVSVALFRSKWDMDPYYEVEVGGWSVLMLDCQQGSTWQADDPAYNKDFGSFGRDQLAWLDQRLARERPTLLVFHNPPPLIAAAEDPGGPWPDLWAVLDAHPGVVKGVFTGHMHLWLDTSSLLPAPGWGLAATRFDHRNWWVVDLTAEGEVRIPQASEVPLGSFFYDEEGDGLDRTPPPPRAPTAAYRAATPHQALNLATLAAGGPPSPALLPTQAGEVWWQEWVQEGVRTLAVARPTPHGAEAVAWPVHAHPERAPNP